MKDSDSRLGCRIRKRQTPAVYALAGVLLLLGRAMAFSAGPVPGLGCCEGIRGNIDSDSLEIINLTDLTKLVDYLFVSFEEPPCVDEADINGDRSVGLSDVTLLVNYLFVTLVPPAPCPPLIEIVGLQPNDDVVQGTAYVTDPGRFKVVLWARTDRWYVQPLVADPFTSIQIGGTWSNTTYPWDRMLALLVDSSYQPGSIMTVHPSTDLGVVAWDEYPDKSARYLDWSGHEWWVKRGDLVGPGPNYFSDDSAQVWVDQQERLHLAINFHNAAWYCAEVVLSEPLGYGVYTFQLDTRVDSLDHNTIFAGFLYQTIDQEFDMEFSQRLASPYNAQYVVQPYFVPGNIEFYDMGTDAQTSHVMEWRSDRIIFTSWRGHASSPTAQTLIHSWTYTGEEIPLPDEERMRFNLYLYGGDAPQPGADDHVIIRLFDYSE